MGGRNEGEEMGGVRFFRRCTRLGKAASYLGKVEGFTLLLFLIGLADVNLAGAGVNVSIRVSIYNFPILWRYLYSSSSCVSLIKKGITFNSSGPGKVEP